MNCVLCHASDFHIVLDSYHRWRIGKCERCGLVQVVPMPSGKEIAALYHEDLEHFEPYVAQLAVHRNYFKKKISDIGLMINENKKARSGKIVHRSSFIGYQLLDIGSAMGVLLEEAQKIGFRARGIDISKDAVAYCRKRKLDVIEGTISSLGNKLKKNSFDVITAFEIIEHERDPLGMMRCVHELLKKDGMAILTTPNHDTVWRKFMGRGWVGYRHPEHVTFWDRHSLTELMERSGFTDVTVRKDSPRPFPLSFLFTRGADYFPCLAGRQAWAGGLLRPIGKLLDRWKIKNPINPWDDVIVYAKK